MGKRIKLDPDRIECIDDQMADIFRNMTPGQRLDVAFGLWKTARSLVMGGLRSSHPDWSEDRIQRVTAKRMSHGSV